MLSRMPHFPEKGIFDAAIYCGKHEDFLGINSKIATETLKLQVLSSFLFCF